jgi:hypothetical protein
MMAKEPIGGCTIIEVLEDAALCPRFTEGAALPAEAATGPPEPWGRRTGKVRPFLAQQGRMSETGH